LDKILELILAVLKILARRNEPPQPPAPPPPPPPPPPVPEPPVKESFFRTAAGEDGLLLFDKLTQMDNLGSEKEVKYNAVSWADGAVMRKKNSSLRYYVGLITSGFVQFDISGLDPATAISRMLFTMWDGNFPADSQNPWLARIQQHSPISTRTKNYLRVTPTRNASTRPAPSWSGRTPAQSGSNGPPIWSSSLSTISYNSNSPRNGVICQNGT
jgi:hypothetical protein